MTPATTQARPRHPHRMKRVRQDGHRDGLADGYLVAEKFWIVREDLTGGEKGILTGLLAYSFNELTFYANDEQLGACASLSRSGFRKCLRRLLARVHVDGRPLVTVRRGRYTKAASVYTLHEALLKTALEGKKGARLGLPRNPSRGYHVTPVGADRGYDVTHTEYEPDGVRRPTEQQQRAAAARGPALSPAEVEGADRMLASALAASRDNLDGYQVTFLADREREREAGTLRWTPKRLGVLRQIRDRQESRRVRDRRGAGASTFRTGEDLARWEAQCAAMPAIPTLAMLLGREDAAKVLDEEPSGAAG